MVSRAVISRFYIFDHFFPFTEELSYLPFAPLVCCFVILLLFVPFLSHITERCCFESTLSSRPLRFCCFSFCLISFFLVLHSVIYASLNYFIFLCLPVSTIWFSKIEHFFSGFCSQGILIILIQWNGHLV